MTDKKKPQGGKERKINESKGREESKSFSRSEKPKNRSDFGKTEYISKPKISSADTTNEKKK